MRSHHHVDEISAAERTVRELVATPRPLTTPRAVLIAAVLVVAGEGLRAVGIPIAYDTVLGVAALLPVAHYRGLWTDSPDYAGYVASRTRRGFAVDSLVIVAGATAVGSGVVWIADRFVPPTAQLLWGIAAAASLIGGTVGLFLLVAAGPF